MWKILCCAMLAGTAAPTAIEIPNARIVDSDVLVGGQPTEDQFREAAAAGYGTVVNLRSEGEEGSLPDEAELVESLGMRYVAIPIGGAGDFNAAAAEKLAGVLNEAEGPVMVHCASGNRVGGLFALKAFLVDGMHGEKAEALGWAYGMRRLPDTVADALGVPRAADRTESSKKKEKNSGEPRIRIAADEFSATRADIGSQPNPTIWITAFPAKRLAFLPFFADCPH